MRFKGVFWNWFSPMVGVHYGRNPVSHQRFLHVAPVPFLSLEWTERPR